MPRWWYPSGSFQPAWRVGKGRQYCMADEFNSYTPGGDAQLLRAEALGEPGQRRFRLVTVIDGETWVLWMEKQQVQALGLALEQLVEHLPPTLGFGAGDPTAIVDEETRNQFRVGRIEIAFDESLEQIVLAAHDIEESSSSDERASLLIRISREIGRSLSEEAAELVARGRPVCPMCGSPMDPNRPHVCPNQNGHLPLKLDEDLF
jgi:uncharacterized repeat protein (TIGR03847 family)